MRARFSHAREPCDVTQIIGGASLGATETIRKHSNRPILPNRGLAPALQVRVPILGGR